MYRNKKGYSEYSDDKVFELLQKTKSEEELATLFQSLRQVSSMKDFAGTMQRYMFARSTFSRSMTNVWLKSRETPNEVFRILRLGDDTLEGNPLLIQWLRYTEMYRATMGANSFSEWQTYRLLLDSKPMDLEIQSATLFQTIKQVPDLKKLAENMQTYLFQKFIKLGMRPKFVASELAIPYTHNVNVIKLPKDDTRYSTLEAYTLQFADELGGKPTLEKVKRLFDNNDPEAAIAAAVKAQS